MADLIGWLLAFIGGIAVGSFTTFLVSRLKGGKKRRTELVNARERILAGIREQHEQDVRREIFRTAEALRGELNRSLGRLLDSTERLLGQVREDPNGKKNKKDTGTLRTDRV